MNGKTKILYKCKNVQGEISVYQGSYTSKEIILLPNCIVITRLLDHYLNLKIQN